MGAGTILKRCWGLSANRSSKMVTEVLVSAARQACGGAIRSKPSALKREVVTFMVSLGYRSSLLEARTTRPRSWKAPGRRHCSACAENADHADGIAHDQRGRQSASAAARVGRRLERWR